MVGGVKVDRAAPRGERELHMGDAYAATAQAIPAGPQYVAMFMKRQAGDPRAGTVLRSNLT
jgi:hypothetical protein